MKKANRTPAPLPAASMDQQAWQAKDDADTLRRAGEVMSDKSRHAAARQQLTKHVQAIQTIQAAGKNGSGKTPSLGFGKKK